MDFTFKNANSLDVSFRALDKEKDLQLLFDIYTSTRQEVVNYPGWNEQQKIAFLNNQFNLQHNAYIHNYPNGAFYILLLKGQEAGRLYLNISNDDLRIIDIALLPFARGKGVGSNILDDLKSWAFHSKKTISIYVEKKNPALNLYTRKGFKCIEEGSVYDLMKTMK